MCSLKGRRSLNESRAKCDPGDLEHFLLHCPRFEMMRGDLLCQLSHIPGIDITLMDSKSLWQLLLFGSTNLNVVENRIVVEATMAYMNATKRLS